MMTTGRKILIIQGHPDQAEARLGHQLAAAYQRGAIAAGHSVSRVEVAHLSFPLLRSQQEWEAGELPTDLVGPQRAIGDADHLVFFYPLWMGTMPALLKGFLEQVLRPDFAGGIDAAGKPDRPLAGKSARIVVTMGMPALAYRGFYRAHSLKSFKRNILHLIGIRPVRSSLIGLVEDLGDRRGRRLLARMESLGRRGR